MTGRVVVVGSVNVDLVIRGSRLPGPGETVSGGAFERHHGGKGGNQAIASARLGAPTLFVGALGDDAFGSDARAAFIAAGVDVSRLATIPDAATGVALILVDATGENLISVAPGANERLSSARVVDAVRRLGPLAGDVVLVSREIPTDAVREALRAGRTAGARTILNPAPASDLEAADLDFVDILVPNAIELATTVAALGGGTVLGGRTARADVAADARRVASEGRVREAVVVTLGADGAMAVSSAGGETIRIPVHPVRALDTTGAGDAFCGALAAMLARGHPFGDAVGRAVVAASLSTRVAGAREGMPMRAELDAALAARGSGSG
ncbi:MAG: ribokinase [Candidatus Limnocylindrales bacterium]